MEKTQDKIGKTFTQGDRDAVHMAVLPVVASSNLKAGQDIGYVNGKTILENPIGIVDPFLKEGVKKGEMFFMFMYPNSITSLRHSWTHPQVNDVIETIAPSKEESEKWLRDFISRSDCPDYDTLIAAASGEAIEECPGYEDYGGGSYENSNGSLFFSGRDAHGEIPEEFWKHIEVVTGKKIPFEKKASSFSCSC